MIAAYQRFYEVEDIDPERNRAYDKTGAERSEWVEYELRLDRTPK